jgi:GTP pyrophosphokinase
MNVVAESGVAAHWLYKNDRQSAEQAERLGAKWLQSLLDIQDETHDASEFWDHVKVDLFPDAVYVFTPKSRIMAMPRGATAVDFAYAVHSNIGDRTMAVKINGDSVPLRTELRNGDVVEIITSPVAAPNPAWLGFVRTGRARSKIRHYLKGLAQVESTQMGQKMLLQALRAEGFEGLPDHEGQHEIASQPHPGPHHGARRANFAARGLSTNRATILDDEPRGHAFRPHLEVLRQARDGVEIGDGG